MVRPNHLHYAAVLNKYTHDACPPTTLIMLYGALFLLLTTLTASSPASCMLQPRTVDRRRTSHHEPEIIEKIFSGALAAHQVEL